MREDVVEKSPLLAKRESICRLPSAAVIGVNS
jgi:hypothetical protein